MTFDEMWELVESQNHALRDGSVTMSSASFKKALRFAFEKGRESGQGESMFNGLFGGGR
jgi:hypothetical protein